MPASAPTHWSSSRHQLLQSLTVLSTVLPQSTCINMIYYAVVTYVVCFANFCKALSSYFSFLKNHVIWILSADSNSDDTFSRYIIVTFSFLNILSGDTNPDVFFLRYTTVFFSSSTSHCYCLLIWNQNLESHTSFFILSRAAWSLCIVWWFEPKWDNIFSTVEIIPSSVFFFNFLILSADSTPSPAWISLPSEPCYKDTFFKPHAV